MLVNINPSSTDWTEEEVSVAVAVLQKIAYCQNMGKGFPGEVFEAHVVSKKNISTEVVIFDNEGRVYLIERPSLAENPSEPYPGQLHSPGVTHGKNEFTMFDTFQRLEKREFGGVALENIEHVAEQEVGDPQRGIYLLRIYTATTNEEPKNPRGKFYRPEDIPWDRLVESHRDVILPIALASKKKGNQSANGTAYETEATD